MLQIDITCLLLCSALLDPGRATIHHPMTNSGLLHRTRQDLGVTEQAAVESEGHRAECLAVFVVPRFLQAMLDHALRD